MLLLPLAREYIVYRLFKIRISEKCQIIGKPKQVRYNSYYTTNVWIYSTSIYRCITVLIKHV